jgi:hypothetical protein
MATKKKPTDKPHAILNRRASFDYALDDELVVGIAQPAGKCEQLEMDGCNSRDRS